MSIGNKSALLLFLVAAVAVIVVLFTPIRVPKTFSNLFAGASNYPDPFSMYSQGALGGKLYWRSCEDRSVFSLSKQQEVGSNFMNSTFYTGVKCNQIYNKYPLDLAVGQFENLDNKFSLKILFVRNFNPNSYDLDLDYGDEKVTSSYDLYAADYCSEGEKKTLINLFIKLCKIELTRENTTDRFCANSITKVGYVTCFSAVQPELLK